MEQISAGNYYTLEQDVSDGFNRLKAKLYNLMELSTLTKEQAGAAKGLIRGFANDEYKLVIRSMRYTARTLKLIGDGEDSFEGAEPLETKER